MKRSLNLCLYNTEPGSSSALREALASLNYVRLEVEVTTPQELAHALSATDISLVFFHLDPDADAVVEVIDEVATQRPDLALMATSDNRDPNIILSAMRSGCAQFVCEPIDPADLAGAMWRAAAQHLAALGKTRVICVLGASGGAGATTIACNLAMEIGNLTESQCALADMDFQFGDVATNFDCTPKYTILDLAEAGDNLDQDLLASAVADLPCRVSLLARPPLPEQLDAMTPEVIERTVHLLTAVYENVVIDLPRVLDARTFSALEHADTVLLVCQLSVASVRNARRTLETLLRAGTSEDRIEVILNRFDGKSGCVAQADLEQTLKKSIYAAIPNNYRLVIQSLDLGQPLASLDGKNPVRVAMRALAEKLLAASEANPADSSGEKSSKGVLRRLFSKS
ncbi:MAG: AAA family ATPase [Planctomycetes bacterium]|nr:AAA family ATPase [Planctomycetota bacterium]